MSNNSDSEVQTINDKKPKQKLNLRRPRQFQVRLRTSELIRLRKAARETDLPMVEYVRCKLFDIPFEHVGGKAPKMIPPDTQATGATLPT